MNNIIAALTAAIAVAATASAAQEFPAFNRELEIAACKKHTLDFVQIRDCLKEKQDIFQHLTTSKPRSPENRAEIIEACVDTPIDWFSTAACYEYSDLWMWLYKKMEGLPEEATYAIEKNCRKKEAPIRCVDLWIGIFETMEDLPEDAGTAIEKTCRDNDDPENCAYAQADAWRTLYQSPQAD